jgi:hypothetical protein
MHDKIYEILESRTDEAIPVGAALNSIIRGVEIYQMIKPLRLYYQGYVNKHYPDLSDRDKDELVDIAVNATTDKLKTDVKNVAHSAIKKVVSILPKPSHISKERHNRRLSLPLLPRN